MAGWIWPADCSMPTSVKSIWTGRDWVTFLEPIGTPLQYSCLENPMDGGARKAGVHGVAKSWTGLSDFTFTFHFHALEKEMATHSSVFAWRIPGTGEPGGLPFMGSHRVGHDWSDLAAAAAVVESILLVIKGWVLCLVHRCSDNNKWQIKWRFFFFNIFIASVCSH